MCPKNPPIKSRTANTQEKVYYMRQLLHAIIHVHSCGYAHRDIKPANVLFDDAGHVKLADFGMCVKFKIGQTSSEYLGSPHYMAPEIYSRQPFDPFIADIWALGVTFYLLCGGTIAWPKNIDVLSKMIRQEGILVQRGLQPEISSMISQMTAMDPEKRPNLATILKNPIFNTKSERSRSFGKIASLSSSSPRSLGISTTDKVVRQSPSVTSINSSRRKPNIPHPSPSRQSTSSSVSRKKVARRRQKSVTPVAPPFRLS